MSAAGTAHAARSDSDCPPADARGGVTVVEVVGAVVEVTSGVVVTVEVVLGDDVVVVGLGR